MSCSAWLYILYSLSTNLKSTEATIACDPNTSTASFINFILLRACELITTLSQPNDKHFSISFRDAIPPQ